MMWSDLKDQAILPILVAGAIVDIVQFLWLIKLGVQKARGVLEDRVRKQILSEMKHGFGEGYSSLVANPTARGHEDLSKDR